MFSLWLFEIFLFTFFLLLIYDVLVNLYLLQINSKVILPGSSFLLFFYFKYCFGFFDLVFCIVVSNIGISCISRISLRFSVGFFLKCFIIFVTMFLGHPVVKSLPLDV